MRILENGIYRDATARELEEAASRAEEALTQPITPEERIEALEAAILELAGVIFNG